jgi:hypothetical protein
MAAAIKSVLNVVVFIVVAIWLLQGFGLVGKYTWSAHSRPEMIQTVPFNSAYPGRF